MILPRAARMRVDRVRARPIVEHAPRRRQLDGKLVAVLDDDASAIDAMHALFATLRADVAGATGPDELLDDLGRFGRYPDLVVADLRLARGMTGVDAIARLRDELGEPVPALIVTGDTSPAAAQLVREAGLPMLAKPVDPTALEDAACELMSAAVPGPRAMAPRLATQTGLAG